MPERVGFVGLGAMGAPMAARLLEAGHDVVVYNRSRARMEPLVDRGARAAGSPADVAREAGHVLSCLSSREAVEEVYLGASGLVHGCRPDQVLVEHGTHPPALADVVARALGECGARFLDAPISGGPERAEAGTLTVMVGGDESAYRTVERLFAAFGERVARVGGSGAGWSLKLVNQLLVSCHVAAYAEAGALLRALGFSLEVVAPVLGSGWAASAMLERGLARAAAGDFGDSGSTIGGLLEPQALALQLAADHGLELSLLSTARSMFARAVEAGLGSHDLAGLISVVGGDAR